jgi:SAM-dependent methyltransferase
MSTRLLERQRKSFDSLVDGGVYNTDFDHPPAAKAFVGDIIEHISSRLQRPSLSVLDCGCGTGAWLAFLYERLSGAGVEGLRLCGFDLSERMVEVAQAKLSGLVAPGDIRAGSILDSESFAFAGLDEGFDLIFTYDVVQQLPRAQQADACRMIAAKLAVGGLATIFDNDAETRFGRRMAQRKFLTRYFWLPLVPRYYCNAVYPQLERIRKGFDSEQRTKAEIIVRSDGIKRAMIVERHGKLESPPR